MNIDKARQVLAELELVSHGTTQAWDTSGGHSSDGPLMPPGEANPDYLRLRAKLAKAMTQTQVDRVTYEARACLKAQRYGPDRSKMRVESRTERDGRIVAEGEGEDPRDLSVRFCCGVSDIHRARISAGRDARSGKPFTESSDADRANVLRLASTGMSTYQVAAHTGLKHRTVARWMAA